MRVQKVDVELFGVFNEKISFSEGLNIISGENGTCKTQVLKLLKQGKGISPIGDVVPQDRVLAFSPKRNSERKNFQAVLQEYRRENRSYDSVTSKRINSALDDSAFSTYPNVSELFYTYFEKKNRSGGEQRLYMQEVTDEFNKVIQGIFSDYEITSSWNETSGVPDVFLKKHGKDIPIESISCGEREMFSLVLNLYVTAPNVDVVLIDEPEVHLNWHLEEKLFKYFNAFCQEHSKQLIVSTHSRVIFKQEYHQKVQFFVWEDGKIVVKDDIPPDQMGKISGEAIDIIKLGDFQRKTVFVEDAAHEETVNAIAEKLNSNINVVRLGNSSNVKSLFKVSLKENGWDRSLFLVDGDGQGSDFPNHSNYVHLDQYCIENYWVNIEALAEIYEISIDDVKEKILAAIRENRTEILKKNKYFQFLFDRLTKDDIEQTSLSTLDASKIVPKILKDFGDSPADFLKKYIDFLSEKDQLPQAFPTDLIQFIKE